MDKDILDIKRRAGLLEDDNVVQMGAKRAERERAANLQRQSELMNTADQLNKHIDGIAELLLKEIEATEFSGWQAEGRPGNFQEYFKSSLEEFGTSLVGKQTEAFRENLEEIILRKIRERTS